MIAKGQQYIMGTYSQAPIVIEKGDGIFLNLTYPILSFTASKAPC